MTDRELMQMALDALEHLQTDIDWQYKSPTRTMLRKAEKALRARLAQPEPEPVAWTVGGLITDFSRDFSAYKTKAYTRPLYTAPAQREWQGLTDGEAKRVFNDEHCNISADLAGILARAIEAKLKEKNNG